MSTDVRSPGGWLRLNKARVAATLVVGALGGAGVFQVYNPVDFKTGSGTETGAVLQVDGVTVQQTVPSDPFTATGGNVKVSGGEKYKTGFFPTLWTSTGAYTAITLSCGDVPKTLPGDVSVVKATGNTGSGAPLQNLNGITLSTGATFHFGTGFTVVGPQDALKFNTLTVPGSEVDCKFLVEGFPLHGR